MDCDRLEMTRSRSLGLTHTHTYTYTNTHRHAHIKECLASDVGDERKTVLGMSLHTFTFGMTAASLSLFLL